MIQAEDMASTMEDEIGACPVSAVMGTALFTLTADTAVASARRLVLDNDIDHLLVLENGTLAGIVCRDDLCEADRNASVADCMTSPVLCITPETTLQEAIDIMGENDVDCLPVVTGTYLVGMVTRAGLAAADLSPSEDGDESDTETDPTDRPCAICESLTVTTTSDGDDAPFLCRGCRNKLAAHGRC